MGQKLIELEAYVAILLKYMQDHKGSNYTYKTPFTSLRIKSFQRSSFPAPLTQLIKNLCITSNLKTITQSWEKSEIFIIILN